MRPSSKLPVLTGAGRAFLSLAMVLLLIGAGLGNWLLAALGFTVLAALCTLYLCFFPTAVLVWRRYLELLWWVPRQAGQGLVAQRPFALRVSLRNLSPLRLGTASVRVFSSRSVSLHRPAPLLHLPRRSEVSTELSLVSSQAGQWFLHGAAVQLRDPLGLFLVEAYFPSSTALKVLPRQGPRAALPPQRLVAGAPDERQGLHTLRHRGVGGELRELREYQPGDPFKLIAWKASARAPLGRLLVRELDRETLLTHALLLDIGPGMREGPMGSWKLDHALELCLAYTRAALDGGDRVGLICFDGAVHSTVRPGEGPAQRLRITEKLLAVMNVVEERFTALTDVELVAAVARYLRQQEGIDVRTRRAPTMEDLPGWSQVAVAQSGEVYNLRSLHSAVRQLLEREAGRGAAGEADEELADMQALRRFCLVRGIELPYGAMPGPSSDSRPAGLSEALTRAAHSGAQRVLLLSDLTGITPPAGGDEAMLEPVRRAVALCRRRGIQLLCNALQSPRTVGSASDPATARVAEIFGWEVHRREEVAQATMARLGFHVIGVGATERNPAQS